MKRRARRAAGSRKILRPKSRIKDLARGSRALKRAAKQRRERIARLAPADVPREFYSMFGEINPAKAERVAEFVDLDQRRSGLRVDVLLLDIGRKEGMGFGLSRGKDYLRAGRYLLNHKENDKAWRRK